MIRKITLLLFSIQDYCFKGASRMTTSDSFYIPPRFRETDITSMHTLMREYPFATLITVRDGAPIISHLPFILDGQRGPYGTLYAHMARANQQWQTFSDTQEALVVFHGPHAYITPSWNYTVVHAHGFPRVFDDPAEVYRLLADQVQTYEAHFESPWPFALPDDFVQKQMRGIVSLALEITQLDGKFKLSQNRPAGDRVHVAEMLGEDDGTQTLSALMQAREKERNTDGKEASGSNTGR
jgi:transcriptional regulator